MARRKPGPPPKPGWACACCGFASSGLFTPRYLEHQPLCANCYSFVTDEFEGVDAERMAAQEADVELARRRRHRERSR